MKKKKSATLIEMIISLALLSFLFSSLFIWNYHAVKKKENLRSLKWVLTEERYAQTRLERIFSRIILDEDHRASAFLSGSKISPSLIFTFDNGPQKDPLLSSIVLARLFRDEKTNCLCLSIWPLPRKDGQPLVSPSKTFILLDKVLSLDFNYYYPPEPFEQPVSPEEITKEKPKKSWQDLWLDEYQLLPTLVKIILNRGEKRNLEFVYDLSTTVIIPKI